MKNLSETIGPFNIWEEMKLILNTLVNKFKCKLVADINAYNHSNFYSKDIRLHIINREVFTIDCPNKNTMSFKEFKKKFVPKPLSFKFIYWVPYENK